MHDLLERLAPEVDVDAAWEEVAPRLGAPGRGRTPRILAIAAALALVVGGVLLANRGGSGDEDGRTELPPVVEYHDPIHDVYLEVPSDWQQAESVLTPGGEWSGRPREIAAVGTYPLRPGPAGSPCRGYPIVAVSDLGPADAFVWVWEQPGDLGLAPRPTEITALPPADYIGDELLSCVDRPIDFRHGGLEYMEAGVNIAVFFALGADASEVTRSQVLAIINSIDVRGSPTTTLSLDEERLTAQVPDAWEGGSGRGPARNSPSAEGPLPIATFATVSISSIDGTDCGLAQGIWRCDPECASWPTAALMDMGPDDGVVWVTESQAPLDLVGHTPRAPLYAELPTERSDGCDPPGADVRERTFDDHGRRITTYVAFGAEASQTTRDEALDILNSLAFDSAP